MKRAKKKMAKHWNITTFEGIAKSQKLQETEVSGAKKHPKILKFIPFGKSKITVPRSQLGFPRHDFEGRDMLGI